MIVEQCQVFLTVVINGKTHHLNSVDYAESVRNAIDDGAIIPSETDIIEYIRDDVSIAFV